MNILVIDISSIFILHSLSEQKMKSWHNDKGLYFKSIPDHGLWLNGQDRHGNLIIKQTIDNIFQNAELQPNAKSFGLKERICFSYIYWSQDFPQFKGWYRNNGILFKLAEGHQGDMFYPMDLIGLLPTVPEDKNEVFKDIKKYYTTPIHKDWKIFWTNSVNDFMERIMHMHIISWWTKTYEELIMEMINSFRNYAGYKPLSLQKHNRLLSYNENIKFTPLKIDIVGTVGDNIILNQKAKEYNVHNYKSVSEYRQQGE